jgi:RNase P subunit RPR2
MLVSPIMRLNEERLRAKIVGRDKSAVKRATCYSCAMIIEYTISEVNSFIHHDYGGGSDTVYYITCPNCGKQMQNVKGY